VLAFLSVGVLEMSVDLKTLTPDTTINDSAVLFGADSQASSTPSVYAVSTVRQHIAGTANTFTQPQIISVNSSSNALRITQTGAGNALLIEDEASTDSSPFVVDQSGNVGIGTTTPLVNLHVQANTSLGVINYTAGGATSYLFRASAGTVASPTIVSNGDAIAAVAYQGYDGATFRTAAQISAVVDGVPGAGDMPGRLVFLTTADGAATPTERMRITNAGNVGIGTFSPAERLDVAGRIRSTPPAGGFAGLTMFTAAASGFAPGLMSFTRTSAAGGATPDNSAVGEFRFDGRDANGSYTAFALISAEMFTNAAGGAPGAMSFSISAPGASAQERMRLTSSGLGIGSTSFGTSAQRVLSIGTGVAPTTGPADTIQIYSTDLSAGNTILSLYTEGTPVNSNTTAAATHRIAVRINGTVYYLLANTAA